MAFTNKGGSNTLFHFFLSIFLFEDFIFQDDRVFLTLKSQEMPKKTKILLSWLLQTLNNETGHEFYFIEADNTKDGLIELKCNSDSLFFKNMKNKIQLMTSV